MPNAEVAKQRAIAVREGYSFPHAKVTTQYGMSSGHAIERGWDYAGGKDHVALLAPLGLLPQW